MERVMPTTVETHPLAEFLRRRADHLGLIPRDHGRSACHTIRAKAPTTAARYSVVEPAPVVPIRIRPKTVMLCRPTHGKGGVRVHLYRDNLRKTVVRTACGCVVANAEVFKGDPLGVTCGKCERLASA
jgi:hypothetical protein